MTLLFVDSKNDYHTMESCDSWGNYDFRYDFCKKKMENINKQDINFEKNSSIQKLGKITFDSDNARKGKNGNLIVKDMETGKDFGVKRENNGSYNFTK